MLGLTQEALERQRNVNGSLSFNTPEYAAAIDMKNTADNSFNLRNLPIGGNFAQSVLNSATGVWGNIADYAGNPDGIGDYLNKYTTAQEMAMGEKPKADFSWDYFLNGLPRDTGNLVGSMGGLILPAAIGAAIGAAAAPAGAAATAGAAFGAIGGGALESMAEGGGKLRESLENGDDLATAQNKARTVAGENAALLIPSNLLGLGIGKKMLSGIKNAYKGAGAVEGAAGAGATQQALNAAKSKTAMDYLKGAGLAGAGAANESFQEVLQQGIQDSVDNKDWGILPQNWNEEQQEAFKSTIGPMALISALGGGARAGARKLGYGQKPPTLEQENNQSYNSNLFGAGTADMSTQGADIDEQVAGLKDGWQNVIPQIGGVIKNQFGIDGAQISSGFRTREHNAEVGGAEHSYHVGDGQHGDALDVVLPDSTTPEQAEAIRAEFENSGAFKEVLFHDSGSGYHLHLGGLNVDDMTNSGSYSGNADIDSMINEVANQYGIDPALLAAVADQESGFNQDANSGAGAIGIMQLTPDTAQGLGVDPNDLRGNLEGGAKYLRQMLDAYNGDTEKALAAYNGGPTRFSEDAGEDISKMPEETQNYVPSVMEKYKKYKGRSVRNTVGGNGSILNWDSVDDDYKAMDFFPKAGEESQGTANEFLENLAKLGESEKQEDVETAQKAMDALEQYSNDDAKLTKAAEELGYKQTVDPADVHNRVPMEPIVKRALQNGEVTFATQKAADIFASTAVGQTMQRDGKTFKVTNDFSNNDIVKGIQQETGIAPYSPYTGTATVTSNGQNGISVDSASANAIANGQSRTTNNGGSSPLTNEDIGRLTAIMPSLPAQVQEQIKQAMANGDVETVRNILDGMTAERPLNTNTNDVNEAISTAQALSNIPEALADRDGMGAVKLNTLQQMIRNGDVNGLNRINKYMADNLRRQGIDPVAALNKKGQNLPAVQGERRPSTNVEETIPTVEGEVEDAITPEAPYTGNQIEAPAVESDHIGSDEFKERLNPVERGFMDYLDKVFENVQMGFDDVLDYLKARRDDIFNKRMETVIQQGVENFAKAFRASGGRILMNEMPSQEVQNAWQQLLAMRANFGATLANAPTEIQNEYMRVEQVVKEYLNPIITEQCQNNESWRKLNYAVTGLETIAKKSRAYERSLQEEGKRSGTKGYRDVSAETREAVENSAAVWADVLHKNGTTDSRIDAFLKTINSSFTRNNHATTLRGKARYNGKAMNKAGRIEALIQDGGRAEDRGGRYFIVAPNGNEIQVTRGEYNYYKWLKQNGFSQQKKAEPAKKDNTSKNNTSRNDTPLLTDGNSRDSERSNGKAGAEQGSAARHTENQGNKKATAEGGKKTGITSIPEKNENETSVNASNEQDNSSIATTDTDSSAHSTGETNSPVAPGVVENGTESNENSSNPQTEIEDTEKTSRKDDEYYGYMDDKSDKEQANIKDLLSKPIKKDSTFGDVSRKERLELAYASGMYSVVNNGNAMYLTHATDGRNYSSKITKAEAEYYNYLKDEVRRAEVANKFTDEEIDRVINNPNKARQAAQAKSIVGMIKKAGIKVVTDAAKIKEVLGDSLKNAYEDSRIQKLIISYKEGEKAPDLTLVKRTINGKDMWGVAFVGEKPKNYIPKKIGKAYKLMEMWPDGSLHALFAGTDKAYKIGEWNWAQGFTPDEAGGIKSMKLAPRYGWHMGTGVPATHHLMGVAGADGKGSTLNPKIGYPSKSGVGHPKGSKRVWVEVHYDATNDYSDIAEKNPGAEKDIRGLIPFGGYYMFQESNLSNWIIASSIKFDHVLSENERQDILSKAGYDEELMWRTYIVSKMLNKQMNPLKAAVATGWKCKNAGKASKAEKEKAKEIMSGPDAPPKYAGWIPVSKLSEKELEKSKKQLEKYQAVYDDNQRAIDAKTDGKDFGFKTLTAEEAAAERKRIREAVYDNPEWKADEEALQEGDGTQYFTTEDGEVMGFVKDGVVYLDPEHMNANTPIHEYTHVWDNVVREVNQELWERGKELMQQSPVWDEVINNPAYADIAQDEDLVASEVHARLTGEKGEVLVDDLDSTGNGKGLAAKLKAWAKEYWQTLKDHFTKWGADEAGKVTLDEFISMPLADLANGVNLAKVEKGKPQQKDNSDSSKNLPKQVEAVALKVFDSLTSEGKEAYELAKEKLRTVGFNENTTGDKNYLHALATMLAFRAQVFANVMQTVYGEKEYTARDYISKLDLRREKIRINARGYHAISRVRAEKEFLLNSAYILLGTQNSTKQSVGVLIHELGHAILKELHNAVLNENCPERLRKDFQTIVKWISTTRKPRTSLVTEDRRHGGYKTDPYVNEEKFAQGLVNYFNNTNRETVPKEVASAFSRIAEAIVDHIRRCVDWLNRAMRGGNKDNISLAQKYGIPEIPDDIAEAIDRIFTGYGVRPQEKEINPKSRAKVIASNGNEYNVHYEVRPESELVASNTADGSINENYPKELQPRNRKRMGNMTQVNKIAGHLKPSLLTANTMLNLGAPLVRRDGVVLNGNGRVMAIRTALKNGTDNNYKDYLIKHAEEFGLDPADIKDMENPVLVKVIDDKLTAEDIDSIINDTSGGQRMSANEQAKADAKKIKSSTLGLYRPNASGELLGKNTDFLATLLGEILPGDELNAYYGENGGITKDGVQRAQRALFALAYGDDHLIDTFAESTNEQAKNFINALNANAPYIAKLQRIIESGHAYDLKLRDSLVTAINELRETILSGKPVERIWREGSVFEEAALSPEVKTMAKIMNGFRKSSKKLTNFIGSMVESGFRHGDPNQMSMFGGVEHSLMEDINWAKEIAENGGQSSLFEDLTENPVNKHSADYLKENGNTSTELDRLPKVAMDKLRKSEQKLAKFGAAIGVNVHFVESSDKGNRGVFTHNGEIYINRKAAVPAKSIFVHEFVHWLKASPENAGAYDVLHACLENLDGIVSKERIEKYRKRIFDGENMTDEEIAEEIICDAMSNSEAAGKLMRAVNNIDASLAAKVGSYLKAMWDKFCKAIGFQPNKLSREQTLPNELSVSEMQKADAALNKILMGLKDENGKPVFKKVGTELFLVGNNNKTSEGYAINPIGYTYAAAHSKGNESSNKQNSNNINGDKKINDKSKYSRSRNAGISPSTNGVAIAQNANNNLLASMKGLVNRLNPLHHEELDNLRIDRKDDKEDLSLVEYTFTSAARLAKKYKAVEPFFNIAKQAVTKQEQLRYYFNSKMNEIDETLGWNKLKNDPKFKERKEQLQKILFDGDVEGREYTNAELAQSGYEPEVIKAYRQMRSLLDYAWKIANDTKARIKYHSLACRSAAIADAEFADIQKKNPFAEMISKIKNADGTVTLNYKEPHIYHVAARNMTTAELNTLKQDKDVYIQSVKQGAVQGNVVVNYDQRNAGLNKRGGYVPHVFHGWYVCKVDKDGKPMLDASGNVATDSIVVTADSMSEAVKLGEKLAKQNKNSNYVVTPQTFSAPGAQEQAVVMGDYDYAKVISKVASSMTMSLADARAMMDGTVKMKNRGRFYGYAMERKGFSGYEQNVYLATMKYFNQTARYVALDPFKRNAISMYNRTFGNFDDANVASRSATAKWIKKYISDMNGTPTFVEKMLNTFLHGLGVGKERAGGRPALWLQQNVFTYPMTIMKLGILNPASSILNLTQLFNLYGALGEKVMSGEGYRRLLENGFRDTFKAMSNKNSALGKLLWEDLGLNYQIGMDISAGYSNAEVTGLGSLHGFTSRMAGKSMYFFRQSDAFARGVTLLTAYNKALSEGKSKAEAIEYAKVINDKVNFDYSVADEPWIFRAFGPISKVLLQFKKYPVKQIELFHDFYLDGRDAGLNKKQSAMRMLKYMAPYMAMSGVSGIPFISLAGGLFSALVATVSGDDDWDWEKKMKQYMIAEFGQDSPLTQWWLYGGGAMLGINIGSRIGVGDFMGSDSYNSADGVGGLLWNQTTLGSTVNQVSKQMSYRNYAEAVKAINPTVGNILQAYKGEVRTTRGRMKYEYQNLAERIWRGIGFTPLNEAMAGDLSSFEYAETQEQTKGKERAVDDFLADPSEENAKRLNEYGVTPKTIQTEAARRTMNRHELNQLEKEKTAKKAKSNKTEKKYSANDYLKKLNEK